MHLTLIKRNPMDEAVTHSLVKLLHEIFALTII